MRGCRLLCLSVGLGGLLLWGGVAHADSVKLRNGSEIVGEILLETKDEVMIKTSHGVLTYSKKQVQSTRRFKLKRRPTPTPNPPEKRETPDDPTSRDDRPNGDNARSSVRESAKPSADPANPVRSLGTCKISLPKKFKAAKKSELPPEALGKAQNLGEFLDSSTGTKVTVIRIDLPEGLPAGTLEPMIWQNFHAMSQSDPNVDFKQGSVGPHRAILGDLNSNEDGTMRKVMSAYVFGHPKGFHVISVSALPAIAIRDSKQLDAIRKSLRLLSGAR